METQMEARMETHDATAEQQTKRVPGRGRVHVALNISKSEYRRMRQRAEREHLSFGQWIERAAAKEMRRRPTV